MKYNIGDIIIWQYNKQELSTLISIYYDWDGEKKYQFESYLQGIEQPIKENYTESELDKFIKTNIVQHYSVLK